MKHLHSKKRASKNSGKGEDHAGKVLPPRVTSLVSEDVSENSSKLPIDPDCTKLCSTASASDRVRKTQTTRSSSTAPAGHQRSTM